MNKLIKLTALLTMVVMVFSAAVIPSVTALPDSTYYLDEDFETGYSREAIGDTGKFLARSTEDYFYYMPDEAGAGESWYSDILEETADSVQNTYFAGTKLSANTYPPINNTYAVREFDQAMSGANKAVSFKVKFENTGHQAEFVLQSSKGDNLVKVEITGASTGLQVRAMNAAKNDYTALSGNEIIINSSSDAHNIYRPATSWHTITIIPNFSRHCYAFLINGDIISSHVMMTYTANGTPDFDKVLFMALADTSSSNYTFTAYFDAIKAYEMSDADAAAYETKLAAYFAANKYFKEDFQWGVKGVDYTEANMPLGNGSYVYKEGTSLPGKSFASDYTLTTTDTTDIKAAIADVGGEYGQVFHFQAGTIGTQNRGAFLKTGKAFTDDFVVLQYDFNLQTYNTSICNYISSNVNASSAEFQNYTSTSQHSANVALNYGGSTRLNIDFNKYFDSDELAYNELKLNKWYKMTYLFDLENATYDYFIDGTLIATNTPRRLTDIHGTFAGQISATVMGLSSSSGEYYADNFEVFSVTPGKALDMTVEGFEKLLGTGVYDSSRLVSSGRTLCLPMMGGFGLSPEENSGYSFRDSAGNLLSENRDAQVITYTVTPDAGNSVAIIFENPMYTYKLNEGITMDDDIYARGEGGLFQNMKSAAGGDTTLHVSARSGKYQDSVADLGVTIKKGALSYSDTYRLTFKRELAKSLIDTLEIGLENKENLSVARHIQEGVDMKYQSYIVNNGTESQTVYGIMAMYAEDGSLYRAAIDSKTFGVGEADMLDVGYTPDAGDVANIASIKLFCWLKDGYTPVLLSGKSAEGDNTYYVSPAGSDYNPGTEDKPWKTFRKAATTLNAGETAVFEDGTYMEPAVTVVANSGTEDRPIIFKARNKHQAKFVYPEAVRLTTKVVVTEKEYITIQDLEITQLATATNDDSSKTMDIMVQCRRSNNISIIGNKIYNTFEEGIKAYLCSGLLIEGNTIHDTAHEGIDFVNVVDSIIRNNEISEAGRVGLMIKGGSKSVQIYNNYIHNKDKSMADTGITIGGSTDNTSTYDSSVNGYEGYNLVAWNNVIVSETPGIINAGISFYGAKNCAAYNNIVIGTKYGMRFNTTRGTNKNWDWDPVTVNPVSKNNIIMDCTLATYYFNDGIPENMVSDYNLFYHTPNAPVEPNSVYQNPLFADTLSDWSFQPGSPAIGAGVVVPDFTGYSGELINVSYDYNWVKRIVPWDMGIYAVNSTEEPIKPPPVTFQSPEFIQKTT